jgi:hypothetical protein
MRGRYSENGYARLFESCAHGMGAEIPKQNDADPGIIEAFGEVVDRRDLLAIAGSYEASNGTGLFWKRVADFAGAYRKCYPVRMPVESAPSRG